MNKEEELNKIMVDVWEMYQMGLGNAWRLTAEKQSDIIEAKIRKLINI